MKHFMTKRFSCLILFGLLLSCTNNIKKNKTDSLVERANNFYVNENYQKAILAYDTLISIDSTKGGYYMKRGYSKTMVNTDDSSAITDYFTAIKRNYSKKETAYLNIGTAHRFNAIFRCAKDSCRIAEYEIAIKFYNESLKINPNFADALKEKAEATENLRQLKLGHWGNPN